MAESSEASPLRRSKRVSTSSSSSNYSVDSGISPAKKKKLNNDENLLKLSASEKENVQACKIKILFLRNWLVGVMVEDVASGTEGLRLDSQVSQIRHSVTNGLPPLLRCFDVSSKLCCPGIKPRS